MRLLTAKRGAALRAFLATISATYGEDVEIVVVRDRRVLFPQLRHLPAPGK